MIIKVSAPRSGNNVGVRAIFDPSHKAHVFLKEKWNS